MDLYNEDFITANHHHDMVGADPLDVLLLMEAADDIDDLDMAMEHLRDTNQQL